ncbi:MAG: TIR domain-containing protein [Polymorphobacter sp.]|uniref:TIR domain-containing protein n=1 Tax=Polymorphobacter sp. TaxID=1909290 RepID=UPI003A88458C
MDDSASEMDTAATGPSLFVSYARADRARVRPLVDALVAAGHAVWWDALIDGGAAFAKTIEARLAAADAVLVVWSANSVDSDWVRDEAAHARDRGRLVPVSLDAAAPPLGFRQYHTIDLSGWTGAASAPEFLSLKNGIASVAKGTPASRSDPAPVPAPTRSSGLSRRILLAGGAVAAAAAGGLAVLRPWQATTPGNALAVLPFANLSGDPGQDYFSQGLCEEVRAALVRITALKVAAPTSSNEFKGRSQDAATIASRLGVDYLLEGSVRKSGDQVRVDVTLTDVAAGFVSWTERFDRKLEDVFAVQSEIATMVAGALLPRVAADDGELPGGTRNIAAYDAFLRGRALFNADAGQSSDEAALAQFESALALDEGFAAAHAARARALAGIASLYASGDAIFETYTEAVAAARTATELAPDLAAAHLALGFATLNGFLDFKGARPAYEKAFALGQGDADILLMYAYFASKLGRGEEARRVIVRAEQLDPLNPRTFRAESAIELGLGNAQNAVARARQALAMNPALSAAHWQIGMAELVQDDPAAARTAFAAEPQTHLRLSGLAIAEHRLGNRAQAEAALSELVAARGDSDSYQQAQVLASWGRPEAALAALERAHDIRDGGMTSILIDPMFAPLQDEAQFKQLLSRMGLA